MTVIVNGSPLELAEPSTIPDLLAKLELKGDRLAVEINRRIIRRPDWPITLLAEGDKVEIVNFVGGGRD